MFYRILTYYLISNAVFTLAPLQASICRHSFDLINRIIQQHTVVEGFHVATENLKSSSGTSRAVTYAIDPKALGNKNAIVILATDGQVVTELLHNFRSNPKTKFLPLAIFGLHHGGNNRSTEYLSQKGEVIFDCHYDLFVNSLPAFANRKLEIEIDANQIVLFGFSNGGAFVYTTAVNNPFKFNKVAAMSVARPRNTVNLPEDGSLEGMAFYMTAGEQGLERFFKANTLRVKDNLDKKGVRTKFVDNPEKNHELSLWQEELPNAISWFFN